MKLCSGTMPCDISGRVNTFPLLEEIPLFHNLKYLHSYTNQAEGKPVSHLATKRIDKILLLGNVQRQT